MAILRSNLVATRPRLVPTLFSVLFLVLLAACSEESLVEPGPGTDDQTTTTESPELETDEDEDDGEVVTSNDAPTTTQVEADSDEDADSGELTSDAASSATATTVVIDETSENASAFTELAGSGLVLSLDEQSCADTEAEAASADGADPVDAIVVAVQALSLIHI